MAGNDELRRIISGCKDGNQECFAELVDLYGARLYGYFYRLSGNRAVSEDLLSELFVKLVGKIKSFKDGRFESWLFRVAVNVFRDYLRDKQRQKKLIEGRKEYLEVENSKTRTRDDEQSDKLQSQLEKLDSETRQLLVMRYYSQLSFKEIAAMRSEPIGTTLSKVHRGLKRLRELMEQ